MKRQQRRIIYSLGQGSPFLQLAQNNSSDTSICNDNLYLKTSLISKKLPQYREQNYNKLQRKVCRSCSYHSKRQHSRSIDKNNFITSHVQQLHNTKVANSKSHSHQIEDQYNLFLSSSTNKNSTTTTNRSLNNCYFSLSNCKTIQNYLLRIRNELSAQKKINKMLKRRNLQLVRENQVFNQYFHLVGQGNKRQLRNQIIDHEQRKTAGDVNKVGRRMRLKHSKSQGKFLGFEKGQTRIKKQSIIIPFAQQTNVARKVIDSKKQSCVTNHTERQKSKQTCHTSRFTDLYTNYG